MRAARTRPWQRVAPGLEPVSRWRTGGVSGGRPSWCVRRSQPRRQAVGLREMRTGLGARAGLPQRQPELVMRLRIVSREPDRLAESLDGAGDVPLAQLLYAYAH